MLQNGAFPDRDARVQASFHGRGPQRARVVGDKTLPQHLCPRGKISSQAHTLSLRDANTRWNHIIHHARQVVDAIHVYQTPRPQRSAHKLKIIWQAWPLVGPHHGGELLIHPLHVQLVRAYQPVRKQVKP